MTGSSPHTRGLHGIGEYGEVSYGIIPAHAGFTSGEITGPIVQGDHPRTRGVYTKPIVRS